MALDMSGYKDLIEQWTKRGQQEADVAGARARSRADQRFGGNASDIAIAAETGARQQALDPTNLNIANIMAQGTESQLGRQYNTSEREAAQKYGTSERLGSQQYGTSERLGTQGWQSAEQRKAEEEAARQRGWQTGERQGTQTWQTGENTADRNWQTGERQGAQTWNAMSQGYINPNTGKWVQATAPGDNGTTASFGYGAAGFGKAQTERDRQIQEHLARVGNPSSGTKSVWGQVSPIISGIGQGLGMAGSAWAGNKIGGMFKKS